LTNGIKEGVKMETIKIALTSLSAYSEGTLSFEWIDLDETTTMQDIKEAQARLGGEEFFISDYEADFKIDEYQDLTKLIEFVTFLCELDDYDYQKAMFLLDYEGGSFGNVLEWDLDNIDAYPDMTLLELAESFLEEGLFGEELQAVWDKSPNYLDIDYIARELGHDYTETDKGCFRMI
jgi:hypothetical protein